MPSVLINRWASAALLGLLYFSLAAGAISFTRFHGGVAFIWVANAPLLAYLITRPPRDWWAPAATCLAGSVIASSTVGLGPGPALPFGVFIVGEALGAAVILQRVGGRSNEVGSHASLPWFLFSAGLVAPACSAFGGAAIASWFGADTYWGNWTNWFTGHALGAITFTPVAVYFLRGDIRAWVKSSTQRAIIEAIGLLTLVALISCWVFAQSAMPLLFLPIVPIIVVTFRSGRLAAAIAVVVLALIGAGFTVAGQGPVNLITAGTGARIQFLQLYLACTVLTILPVAAELARRKSLYQRLHDSEARYRILTENSTDIILNLEVDGRIRFASPAIQQIGGYDPDDVVGRNAVELVDPRDVEAVRRAHLEALSNPNQTVLVEYRAIALGGQPRWFETQSRAVVDHEGQVSGVVNAVRDIEHRKKAEDRLVQEAMTDKLTGIANRRAFDAYLERAIGAVGDGRTGCVALFDLDHFKAVNDRHGHAAGDAVLRLFAETTRGRMRDNDLFSRFGGEEFAMIMPGASPEQARLICDRLRNAVAEMVVPINGQDIRVTVSGGVTSYDSQSKAEDVIDQADAALYRAKASGRDQLALAA